MMHKFFLFLSLLCVIQLGKCQDASPVREAMDRILYGVDTEIEERPFQVALVTRKNNHPKIVCGGALVKPKVIFTAAHCTHVGDGVKRPHLSVLVGANSLSDPRGHQHKIEKIYKHPDFAHNHFDNDFSVIVLRMPVKLGSRAQTIPISYSRTPGGTRATVSGYGNTEYGFPSHNLKSVGVVVEDFDRCQDYFPKAHHPEISPNMLCIKPGRKGTSFGDSGSPLVVNGNLVGLVSFGRTLSNEKKVTVFTKVKNFLDFVETTVPDF